MPEVRYSKLQAFDLKVNRHNEMKTEMPKMYKSHPAYGAHVVELPSGETIWNLSPFYFCEI